MKRTMLSLLIAGTLILPLGACTSAQRAEVDDEMDDAGNEIENAGDEIEEAADDAEDDLDPDQP